MAFPRFEKTERGLWQFKIDAGPWEGADDPVFQSIMQHVESVDYKGLGGAPRFHLTAEYQQIASLGVAIPVSVVSYEGMFDRYQATKQSSQPAVGMDIRAEWKKYFPDTGMPDVFLRNQSGQIEHWPLLDENGEEVLDPVTGKPEAGDRVIDTEKLKQVLDQINERRAADPSAAQIISVEGIQDKFVNIGGQIFKTKASATMVAGKPQFYNITGTDSKAVVYGNTMQIVQKSDEDWTFSGTPKGGYVEVSSGRWVEAPTGEAKVITDGDSITGYTQIRQPGGEITTVPERFTPGVMEDGDVPGYDLIQQPTGQITPLISRGEGERIIDPTTMTPYFRQPDGSLTAAPMPSVDDVITQYLAVGDFERATTLAAFRDKPTAMEYFDRVMEWARSPADLFTVSAIVRGMYEPELGPMGETRRIGRAPQWAQDAWLGLQNAMGVPPNQLTAKPGDNLGTGNPDAANNAQSSLNINTGIPTGSSKTPDQVIAEDDSFGKLLNNEEMRSLDDQGIGVTTFGATGSNITLETLDALRSGEITQDDLFAHADPITGSPAWNALNIDPATDAPFGQVMSAGDEAYYGLYRSGIPMEDINEAVTAFITGEGAYGDQDAVDQFLVGWLAEETAEETAEEISEEVGGQSSEYRAYDPDDFGDIYQWQGGLGFEDPEVLRAAQEARAARLEAEAAQLEAERVGASNDFAMLAAIGLQPPLPEGPGFLGTSAAEGWAGIPDADIPWPWHADIDGAAERAALYGVPPEPVEAFAGAIDVGEDRLDIAEPESTLVEQAAAERIQARTSALEEQQARMDEFFPQEPDVLPLLAPTRTIRIGESFPDARAAVIAALDTGNLSVSDALAIDAALATRAGAFEPEPVEAYGAAADIVPYVAPTPVPTPTPSTPAPIPTPTTMPEIIPLPSPTPPRVPTPPAPTEWAPTPNWNPLFDAFQFGGYSEGGMAMVGEEGPELVDLPEGAQVYPAGVTELLTGRPTRRPRSLFRPAGMRVPSAQAISNLLPEEMEVYQELGRLAGIPEKAFEREFRSAVPMGQGGTRQARFAPRQTGRTRYGTT